MINKIYFDGSGHKVVHTVKTQEEYFALRNTAENRHNLLLARNGDDKAKRKLVQFNYNARVADGEPLAGCRSVASTCAGDIDCYSPEERQQIADRILSMAKELDLLELSRSVNGLHWVRRRKKGQTILENQVEFAIKTQTEMDTNAHDLQRVMFTIPADESELLFFDKAIFEEPLSEEESRREFELLQQREQQGEENVPGEAHQANKHYRPTRPSSQPLPIGRGADTHTSATGNNSSPIGEAGEGSEAGSEFGSGSSSLSFKGIPYSSIISEWWNRNGGVPAEGERNVKLHRLAVNLRAICDNKREVLMQVLPRLGLTDQELRSIVDSACKEEPKGISKMMTSIIEHEESRMRNEQFGADTEVQSEALRLSPGKLPVGLKESLAGVPETMYWPVICSVLAIAGAYSDQVEVKYCDGHRQKTGFMSIVLGDQASGKSVCKYVIDIWKRQLDEEDVLARKREEEWKERKKGRKSNEKAPDDPKVLIRVLPVTVSCSTLLKRLKYANGHTLYSFGEELDTLRKTNGAGSWSAKYDIYRLSFDQGEWGQDYNSDQAESGMVKVAYNWTVLGTYGAMRKCFKSDNIENGLSSRVLVAEMPDSSFSKMPKYGQRTAADEAGIQEAVNILRRASGFIDTPRLRKAIDQWVEEKRVEAAKDIDRVKDTYRKRAAVIGFRAGVIFRLLEGKESKRCIEFAVKVAEYCLKEQIKIFGKELQSQYIDASQECQRYGRNHSVFDQLPPTFTMDDLRALKNGECGESGLRNITSRWMRDGWIEKADSSHWKKLPQCPNVPLSQ